ncbi:hypothetical protein [Streptomyces gilvosporeus]|uniref:hypothetical protein n=1 Tax=Streptomyces gilvosporeus TaxID=553510 RepID=UPI00131EBE2E|nr:hypothetical protein [Streptomyces gilvosporeus]
MTYADMLDFPGFTIRLEREFEYSPSGHLDLADTALEAVFNFSSGLCEPLSMSLWSEYWMDDFDLPLDDCERESKFLMLRRHDAPEDARVRAYWVNGSEFEVGKIDKASSFRFVKGALQHQEGDRLDLPIGWQEIQFKSMLVRLPDNPHLDDADSFRLGYGDGFVYQRVEKFNNASWVYGPVSPKTQYSPIEYRISREPEVLSFQISIYWSTWAENGPDHENIAGRVAALLDNGWVKSR